MGCHALLRGNLPHPKFSTWVSCIAGGFFTPEQPGKPYTHTHTHTHTHTLKTVVLNKISLEMKKSSRSWQLLLGCKHWLVCGCFDREGSFFFLKAGDKILFVVNALFCTTFLSSFFLLIMQAARTVCAWEVLLQGFTNPFKIGFLYLFSQRTVETFISFREHSHFQFPLPTPPVGNGLILIAH